MILILFDNELTARKAQIGKEADLVAIYENGQYEIIKSRDGELKVCNHIELEAEIEKVYASKIQRQNL